MIDKIVDGFKNSYNNKIKIKTIIFFCIYKMYLISAEDIKMLVFTV